MRSTTHLSESLVLSDLVMSLLSKASEEESEDKLYDELITTDTDEKTSKRKKDLAKIWILHLENSLQKKAVLKHVRSGLLTDLMCTHVVAGTA